eukprot:113343_1
MLTMQPVNIDINIERSNLNDNDEDIFMTNENSQSMIDDNIFAISFDCHTILQSTFKHKSFRDNQLDIIIHIINGGDGLVLLPTGGGKSLCYQLPAVYHGKPAFVISPLVSLISDQIVSLKAKGINATTLTKYANDLNRQIAVEKPDIIYSTPESLNEEKYPKNMNALIDIHSTYGLSHIYFPLFEKLLVCFSPCQCAKRS